MSIQFMIPGIPVAKGRPRFTKTGIVYTPKKTKEAEAHIMAHAAIRMKEARPLLGPLTLRVNFYMPIPESYSKKKTELANNGKIFPAKTPDASNLLKLVEDSLNGVCWSNDSQIVSLSANKYYSDEPRTVVTVMPVIIGDDT